MSTSGNNITLAMLLAENKRIRSHMQKHYPAMVKEEKITPYERDHRLACNEKIISLLQQAINNQQTNGAKLLQILNQQP